MLLFMEKLKYPRELGDTERKKKVLNSSLRFSAYLAMIWCVVAVWVVLQAADVGSSFIYFQF